MKGNEVWILYNKQSHRFLREAMAFLIRSSPPKKFPNLQKGTETFEVCIANCRKLVYNRIKGGERMLSFGEVLDFLMKQHNCQSKELCVKLNMKKSYFSRLKNGKLPPKNYTLVEEISIALGLPTYEKQMLAEAYKMAKFGEKFFSLEAAVNQIYHIGFPMHTRFKETAPPMLKHGDSLDGMAQIAAKMRLMLAEEGDAELLFIPENAEFCELLCQVYADRPHKADLHWLLYLNGQGDCPIQNVSFFSKILSTVLVRPADVRFRYRGLDEYFSTTMLPHMLVTKSGALLMERNCERAYYFDRQEFLELCRNFIRSQYDTAQPFFLVLNGFEDYLENWKTLITDSGLPQQDDLLIVEKYPCIIHEADRAAIRSHIADGERSDELAAAYMEFLHWSAERLRTQEMLFTEQGMKEYFSMEEFYEYSQHITKPISKPLRMEFFRKLIAGAERSNLLMPEILRVPLFEGSSVRVINVWSSGIMLIVFHFEECSRIAVLQEKTISKAIWDYFQKLKECGMVLSKRETLGIMEKTLGEYKN